MINWYICFWRHLCESNWMIRCHWRRKKIPHRHLRTKVHSQSHTQGCNRLKINKIGKDYYAFSKWKFNVYLKILTLPKDLGNFPPKLSKLKKDKFQFVWFDKTSKSPDLADLHSCHKAFQLLGINWLDSLKLIIDIQFSIFFFNWHIPWVTQANLVEWIVLLCWSPFCFFLIENLFW